MLTLNKTHSKETDISFQYDEEDINNKRRGLKYTYLSITTGFMNHLDNNIFWRSFTYI